VGKWDDMPRSVVGAMQCFLVY